MNVVFSDVQNMGDHIIAHICPDCAKKHGLDTVDTCCNGNVCLVKGCWNETSLVHYLWDNRSEIIENENALQLVKEQQLAEQIADRLLTVYGGRYERATLLIPAIPNSVPFRDHIQCGNYNRQDTIEAILEVLRKNRRNSFRED